MNVRRTLRWFLILALVVCLPGIALAALSSVTYTGQLFSQYGPTFLSAQVAEAPPPAFGDPVPSYPVFFWARTLWNQNYVTPTTDSDEIGTAFAYANWPPGVYRLYADAIGLQPGQTYVYTKQSVQNVLTVYSRYVRGIAVGGETTFGTAPTRATVGFIYQNMFPVAQMPLGQGTVSAPYANLRALLINVDPPAGYIPAMSVWALDFKHVLLNHDAWAVRSMDIDGQVWVQIGQSSPVYANMSARFDYSSSPGQILLSIYVWKQTASGIVVYLEQVQTPITNGGFFVKLN